jgi:hypothetical protein
MSDSSRHNLFAIAEATYGTTPATPAFKTIRHTGTTLALSKNTMISEELRADRQISDFRHGTKQTGGDISGELSFGTYDDFFEAVLGGTWAADVLKAGVTRRSFSIMRNFADLAGGAKPYHIFRGQEYGKLALTVSANAIVKSVFSAVGKSKEVATTAPAGSTYVAAGTTGVMDSFSGAIKEGGVAIAVVTELSMTLENGIEPRFVIGSAETIHPGIGRSNLTGQITAYFEDSTLLDKFINETESSLEFELADKAGNKYTFLLPRIKYTGGQPDTQGQGPITLAMPFQALYDSTEATNIKITRDAV